MKIDITKLDHGQFRTHKTVSIKEVMDAGGPEEYAKISGKSTERLIKRLEKLPPIEPFTDEEWADLLIQMANDK